MSSANKVLWFFVIPSLFIIFAVFWGVGQIKAFIDYNQTSQPTKSVDELDAQIKADTARHKKWEEEHGLATPSATVKPSPKTFTSEWEICELGGKNNCWTYQMSDARGMPRPLEKDGCVLMFKPNDSDQPSVKVCHSYSIKQLN